MLACLVWRKLDDFFVLTAAQAKLLLTTPLPAVLGSSKSTVSFFPLKFVVVAVAAAAAGAATATLAASDGGMAEVSDCNSTVSKNFVLRPASSEKRVETFFRARCSGMVLNNGEDFTVK